MAKAIKVKEAFYNKAKKALEQAKITHSWDTHPNAHKTCCLIVRNKDKNAAIEAIEKTICKILSIRNRNAAIEAIEKTICKILSIRNRRHWEWVCLNNGYWEWTN